jgi:hypothetical protein
MRKNKRLWDAYQFPGFLPGHNVLGIFGDAKALVIPFVRWGKKRPVVFAEEHTGHFTIARSEGCGIFLAQTGASFWMWRFGAFFAEAAPW